MVCEIVWSCLLTEIFQINVMLLGKKSKPSRRICLVKHFQAAWLMNHISVMTASELSMRRNPASNSGIFIHCQMKRSSSEMERYAHDQLCFKLLLRFRMMAVTPMLPKTTSAHSWCFRTVIYQHAQRHIISRKSMYLTLKVECL